MLSRLTGSSVGEMVIIMGVVFVIGLLIIPLPSFMLDLFLAISMAILSRGRRLGLIALVSAAMALGGWALFIVAFDTRFPRGWFEEAMAMVPGNG